MLSTKRNHHWLCLDDKISKHEDDNLVFFEAKNYFDSTLRYKNDFWKIYNLFHVKRTSSFFWRYIFLIFFKNTHHACKSHIWIIEKFQIQKKNLSFSLNSWIGIFNFAKPKARLTLTRQSGLRLHSNKCRVSWQWMFLSK